MKLKSGDWALVTGAAGGVGSALVEALLRQGVCVIACDISEKALATLARDMADVASKCGETLSPFAGESSVLVTYGLDVSDSDAWSKLAEEFKAADMALALLVNNAGITYQKSFATHSLDDWERIVGINWWGVLYGCHHLLPALRHAVESAGAAHIVNMSSMSGSFGLPGQTSYCATKGAVKLLSEAMWAEMGKLGIGVTSVHPGAIQTDMIQATVNVSDDVDAAQRNYRLAQKMGVSADYVAKRILKAVEKDQMRIRVGKDSVILDILKRIFPVGFQKLMKGIA